MFVLTKEMITKLEADRDAFKNYLCFENIVEIEIDGISLRIRELSSSFYMHLGQALKGTCVTTVSLVSIKIAQQASLLGQALEGTAVTTLKLCNTHLGECAVILARVLHKTSVSTLSFSANNIGQYAPALVMALQNTKVSALSLMKEGIAKHIGRLMQALQFTKIVTLNVSQNAFHKRSIMLAQGLKNTAVNKLILEDDWLFSCSIEFMHALKDTQVTALSLRHCGCFYNKVFVQALINSKIKSLHLEDYDNMNEEKIHKILLENCRRDYIERLSVAEYHGMVLKTLYRETFPENTLSFPPSIARLIGKFLGHEVDPNLFKRFLQAVKGNFFE